MKIKLEKIYNYKMFYLFYLLIKIFVLGFVIFGFSYLINKC